MQTQGSTEIKKPVRLKKEENTSKTDNQTKATRTRGLFIPAERFREWKQLEGRRQRCRQSRKVKQEILTEYTMNMTRKH